MKPHPTRKNRQARSLPSETKDFIFRAGLLPNRNSAHQEACPQKNSLFREGGFLPNRNEIRHAKDMLSGRRQGSCRAENRHLSRFTLPNPMSHSFFRVVGVLLLMPIGLGQWLMTNLVAKLFTSLGLTQLMSLCVGADDSLPENIFCKGLKPSLRAA